MNAKKILVVVILGLVILIAIPLLFFPKQTSIPNTQFAPTPTPVSVQQIRSGSSIKVTSSEPKSGTSNVPTNQKIVIELDRPFKDNEIEFSISPSVKYSYSVSGSTLTITPLEPLSPGTTYAYSVNYNVGDEAPKTYTFTTEGPTPSLSPNTFPSGAYEQEQNFQKQTYPDLFLKNQTPYSDSYFSITGAYKSTPTGHFAFTVVLTGDHTASQNDFLSWLKSLGLTDSQIQTLDISYQ